MVISLVTFPGMSNAEPFDRHRERVQPDWIDYNGHMNVAYYVLAFDHATDTFFEDIGIGPEYRAAENCSIFVSETHVNYFREVHEGDPLRITTQVLDIDHKRVHIYHRMFHESEGYLAASTELVVVHVDLGERRSSAWRGKPSERLEKLFEVHRMLEWPEKAGRKMGIKR
jgi:acyl-CoA thioester hydrolase